jgi:hypothetical protein
VSSLFDPMTHAVVATARHAMRCFVRSNQRLPPNFGRAHPWRGWRVPLAGQQRVRILPQVVGLMKRTWPVATRGRISSPHAQSNDFADRVRYRKVLRTDRVCIVQHALCRSAHRAGRANVHADAGTGCTLPKKAGHINCIKFMLGKERRGAVCMVSRAISQLR